jgi:hypothetical protein
MVNGCDFFSKMPRVWLNKMQKNSFLPTRVTFKLKLFWSVSHGSLVVPERSSVTIQQEFTSDIFVNDNNNENDNDMASVHDNDNENEYIFAERKLNNKEKDCRRTE